MSGGGGRRRRCIIAVGLLGVLCAAGAAAVAWTERGHLVAERSPAERGRRLAREAGCFGCHADGDGPGAPNRRRSASGDEVAEEVVPPLAGADADAAALRQWIRNGVSDEKARSPVHMLARDRKLLRMPAYGDRLAPAEVEDMVAWLSLEQYRVAAAAEPPPDTPLGRGERLARALGCFACHGELGQGGVANRGALKGYIPGFFGRDFELLTQGWDRAAVREWIRDGVSGAFADSTVLGLPVARTFLERQAVGMPAFAAFAQPDEIEALVEYTLALRRLGPLDAKGVEAYIAAVKRKNP